MVFTKLRRTRARERSHTNESHRGRSRRETSRRTLSDENTHQNLHRLVTVTDGDVRGNLFVTADTERTDGVSRLGEDRLLTGELLQNLYSNARDAIRQSRGSLALERIRPKPRAFASNHTHLGRLREAIPAFPNANVKDELVDANSPHRVLSLFFSLRARSIDRHGQSPLCHSVCVATRPRIGDADATPTRRDTTTITPPHTCTRARPAHRAASPHPSTVAPRQNPKTTIIAIARRGTARLARRRRCLRDTATMRDAIQPTRVYARPYPPNTTPHEREREHEHDAMAVTSRTMVKMNETRARQRDGARRRIGARRAWTGFGHSAPPCIPNHPYMGIQEHVYGVLPHILQH